VPSLRAEGTALLAHGKIECSWAIQDISDKHDLMGTSGNGVLTVIKARMLERKLFERLQWIQYTEAVVDGKVYVPQATTSDPTPWPWGGMDRYRHDKKADRFPHFTLWEEQQKINWGHAYHGAVKGLYSQQGADSIFIDWAASSYPHWTHYSTVMLMGRSFSGKEYSLGAIRWEYARDASSVTLFGGCPASEEDAAVWQQCLKEDWPDYIESTFAGIWSGHW
jgi:hypothetical protein